MTSTFRLTRAEFKKIFKRPAVYIMALMLVATIFVSLYIFEPRSGLDLTIIYDNKTTSTEYYNTFYNEDLTNSKIGIDKSFSDTDSIYNYYFYSNQRDNNLEDYYNDVIQNIETIRNTSDISLRNKEYQNLKSKLQNFLNAFRDFSDLRIYPHIYYSSEYINNINDNTNYYLTEFSHNIQAFLDYTNSYDSFEIIEVYDTNNYKEKLNKDLSYGTYYVLPTLYSMSKDIKDNYDDFNTAYQSGTSGLITMEISRKSILKYTEALKKYFDLLVDNKFPIILIDKNIKQQISSTLDSAIVYLTASAFVGTTANMSDYTNLKSNLDSINLANYFTTIFSIDSNVINQIKLSASDLELFTKLKNKVDRNKAQILDEINSYRQDQSIKNIQFKITEYSLLASSYNEYINDYVIQNLSNDYVSNKFNNLYGYNLNNYNNYEYKERIEKNAFYINNNIYSNSFNTNFTFNQNSGQKTNVYDFVYFTMEFCTIIIILFAMLLICNLITSETESGTIKLLLARPYKRSKIITAKLLATIFFVVIFVIFSALISFAGGYFMFGLDNTPILSIFNSSHPIVMSPIALMLLNILSLILDIIFYVLIALMISILFKNYAGSVTVCLVILILNYVLNILFANAFWYSLLPGMNLHLFKYFGNAFTAISSESILQNILITPIQSSMNFLYSILISICYSTISIFISYTVFNKRDF